MRILLHSCCAPCATFPLFLLRSEGYEVGGLYYNPNIDPAGEAEKRWQAFACFGAADHFDIQRADSPHEEWLAAVRSCPEKPDRCLQCYRHRLLFAARHAKAQGYDAFTTSLLLSIYQDHAGVAKAGEWASEEAGVPFIYRDFRVGYRRSREIARGRHMYMQKYCGCEFSRREAGR